MQRLFLVSTVLIGFAFATGCGRNTKDNSSAESGKSAADGRAHTHRDGSTHDHHAGRADKHDDEHAHDEVSLGSVKIGDMVVELAQGHGAVKAGAEGHLVVKLPYNDKGATIVRAWLGTQDRAMSLVGKAEYAPEHDDYDVQAMAPDPLPANVQWWIEIEKPDGTKLVGSADPLR